jgi:hypothetical protein
MISLVPSYIYPVRLSKRMSSSIALRIDSVWKFLPRWMMEFGKIPFPFRASARVAGPRRSNNEAQNKQSHEAQSDSTRSYVAHAQKEKLHGKPRSFPPFDGLNILLSPQSMHRSSFFVPPLLHKSRDEISFRGAVTPYVTKSLITLIRLTKIKP